MDASRSDQYGFGELALSDAPEASAGRPNETVHRETEQAKYADAAAAFFDVDLSYEGMRSNWCGQTYVGR